MFNDQENTIYQLNMGEGKTSVILILLSLMMANNNKNIVRINCLESLFGVMNEILRNKFCKILNKRVYIMPFSRDVEFSAANIDIQK